MTVSVKNLIAAVEMAHDAIITASNNLVPEDEKSEVLLGAAVGLCKQLGTVRDDPQYWAALKGGSCHPDASKLNEWLSELAANRDGRRDDLAELFARVGYEPPDAAQEVVRGFVSSIYAASLIGVGKDRTTHAGISDAALLKIAQDNLTSFANTFCEAETHIRKTLRGKQLTEKAKKAANSTLLKLVTWAAGVGTIAIFGWLAGVSAEHLPPKANAFICEHTTLVPETIKPMVKQAFCVLPNDAIDPNVRIALLRKKVQTEDAELGAVVKRLEDEIARGEAGIEALNDAKAIAADANRKRDLIMKEAATSKYKFKAEKPK